MDSFAYTEAIQAKAMKENIEKRGVKNMYWSKDMLDTYKKAWEEVMRPNLNKGKLKRQFYE